MTSSAALTTDTHEGLVAHLDRPDRQEDLCFALYRLSEGAGRRTTIVTEPILPRPGEREVHGNVEFSGPYFLRAATLAAEADSGLALLHSHPGGQGWQGMSPDDVAAEQGHAAQALELTELPLLGLTLATGEQSWSARLWPMDRPGHFPRDDCESVRVVGDRLALTFNPAIRPALPASEKQLRTVSAWGDRVQADLARLRIAVVGTGSVGCIVAEALARTGIADILLVDFDTVEMHNLDRLLHASERDARLAYAKVGVLARALRESSTAADARIDTLEASVVEPAGWAAVKDCDVVFSCVDRPWPRAALNLLAYAHLIPVIDGGIKIRAPQANLLGADWRALTAAPTRRCLECAAQYRPEHVSMERDGLLDDPRYIEGLPDDSPLKRRENVFAFSANVASFEVLQLLSMVAAPQDVADVGIQNHHFVTGELDTEMGGCKANCLYSGDLLARGDQTSIDVTGQHKAAEQERAARAATARRFGVRLGRSLDAAGRWLSRQSLIATRGAK